MFKKNYHCDYNLKNIQMVVDSTLFATLSANFLAPLIIMYVTYEFIDKTTSYIWLSLHLFLFILRLFINKKIQHHSYFKAFLSFVFITALLNIYMVCLAIINNIPDLNIFILSIVIITLSACSISTLIGVYYVFVTYVLINMIPLIVAILYHGGDLFFLFAFILVIFTILIIKAGRRQYHLINNLIRLQKQQDIFHDTLQKRVEKNPTALNIILNKENTKTKKSLDTQYKNFDIDVHLSQNNLSAYDLSVLIEETTMVPVI
jgi:hypothetical protein